ncbi:molybdopterin molybdotransferase MoeA [Rhodanobacter sp. C01]|uniref:molybdopterin molybdotransferase MoeA n=1 Tax=Rhodanobacter sp. C01 TaxID=1945856 RepID=UPI000985EB7D|nr:molybdopterin molybdotransferase MoeA [Rhodanobacter sp. C01]OOG47143.1 molybdopterin molybdenumtransferase MoeA [Rhodanobacter sp. C01]
MIEYTDALQRLLAQAVRLPPERCPVDQALGRITAAAIRSPLALPTFDHAAMDGYALRVQEPLAPGSEHAVQGSQAAGDPAGAATGDACEIMTGARLPDGLNSVIAVENTQLLATHADGMPARIRLLQALDVGQNVRHAGSDVAMGSEVIGPGIRIDAAHVMLLAALGIGSIAVARRPRVAIICTGKELQADRSQPLQAEHIHNSNGPYLVAALGEAGAHVHSCVTVDDTAVTYADALARALDAGVDLVLSTGAVSMGRYDFVPELLRDLGAELLFHGVAMRPGKPLLCARLAQGPLLLALPGTPMAVAAAMRFFVAPVLRTMLGQGSEPALHAVLDTPQQPKSGLRHFLRATLHLGDDGRLHARVLPQQQPFRIYPYTESGAWVVLPEHAGDCGEGSIVEVASLAHGQPPRIDRAPS